MPAAPLPQPAQTPIYSALAARWANSGRSVPGRPDREWTELVRRCPWPCW